MDILNLTERQLLLPPGPESIKRLLVSKVKLPYEATSILRRFFAENLNEQTCEMLNKNYSIISCQYSMTIKHIYGGFHYNVDSFSFGDTQNNSFWNLAYWLVKHNFINGIILSGFDRPSMTAQSCGLRHLVSTAKYGRSYRDSDRLNIHTILKSLWDGDARRIKSKIQDTQFLEVFGIEKRHFDYTYYGCPVNVIRELIEDRYDSSKFTVLSTQLKFEELRDYFGLRIFEQHLQSRFLYIEKMEEMDV